MSVMVSQALLTLFSVCMAVGAFDHFHGNPWKPGERFFAKFCAPLYLLMEQLQSSAEKKGSDHA